MLNYTVRVITYTVSLLPNKSFIDSILVCEVFVPLICYCNI